MGRHGEDPELLRMELTTDVISRVVHPTAAFVDTFGPFDGADPELEEEGPILWSDSELNPKNRIDSLDEVCNPKWRIDGSAGMGTQFFTVPLFFTGKLIPIRIDTFIPESSKCPPRLRRMLELDAAFHIKDVRVARLGISRHVLRTLEHWSSKNPDLEIMYSKLPFGSRIVFENLATDIRDIRICIMPNHNLERQLLSFDSLQSLWNLSAAAWPKIIDIGRIRLCRQLHDSVSLVQVLDSQGPQMMVLKALTSYPKYLYHELRILLTLPPHPNIISRPRHIITKKCSFGGKTAILGFTMLYHPAGTLRDILPFRSIHGNLRVADQLKWAIQLTSALIHIYDHGRFYSDLRLDNILLSDNDDLVLVDFEQRGVWCAFGSPELNYLDYVFMLATDSNVAVAVREKYEALLKGSIPGYKALLGERYSNSEQGYFVPWSGLSGSEQEATIVFMLGRVLWCIFEGQSCPEVAVFASYSFESELEFPAFRNTPSKMRELIRQCTSGREITDSWYKGGVVRKGNRLALRTGDRKEGRKAVQAEATRWWKRELQEAETFLETRLAENAEDIGAALNQRPNLNEVLEMLQNFQGTLK